MKCPPSAAEMDHNQFFVLISILLVIFFAHSGQCVSCYKCNERIRGKDSCQNATEEDCATVFPSQESICLKTVQKFSNVQPSWVFAQCQLKQAFSADQLDSCELTQTQGSTKAGDTLESCTCTADLCNRSSPLLLRTNTILHRPGGLILLTYFLFITLC